MNKQEYNQQEQPIIDLLTPKVQPKPSPDLKERILKAVGEQQKMPTIRKVRLTVWLRATASMAALVAVALTVVFNTPAGAARRHFSAAITAANEIKTMIMNLNVRTEAYEPMEYINPECDFVPASVKVINTEPMVWSIEKQGGRKLLDIGDGKLYQWNEGSSEGWYHTTSTLNSDWAMFLAPQELLDLEMRIANERRGAKYEVTEKGNIVEVRVTSPAEGDFSESNYSLNSSLAESNTIREYVFDKQSGRLLEMHIEVVTKGNKRVTIVESTNICYDCDLTAESITFREFPYLTFSATNYTSDSPSPLVGITAEEAAEIILEAMGSWNDEILATALYYYKGSMAKVAEMYEGLRVVSIGDSFKSGLYAGRFVPCKVILASGREEELTIALRNDNINRVWLLDGGI